MSHFVALAAPTRAVDLSVHLPLRNAAELDQLIALQADETSPLYHHFLSVAQFRAAFGPTAQSFARAEASLRARGFSITAHSTQSIRIHGNAATVERAFGTRLGVFGALHGTSHVAIIRPMTLTPELAAMGARITGIDNLPRHRVDSARVPLNRYAPNGPYWFTDFKEAYTYPSFSTLNGKGATIGIVMSSDVLDSDTKLAFDHEKFSAISGKPVPTVLRSPVLGGAPFGGIDNGASDEASVDVQSSLGSAPGATDILYDIPDLSDESVIAGYTQVVEQNVADVVSSSFGECELFYTAPYNNGLDMTGYLQAEHELFRQGNSQGITFLASSGDNSGLECSKPDYLQGKNGKFTPGVSTPADDPNVTAVGGTNLETTTPPSPAPKSFLTSKYVSESEYGDPLFPYDPYGFGATLSGGLWGSGSGASKVWAKPSYQRLVATGESTRATPDVSMQMGGCPGGISASCKAGVDSSGAFFIGGSAYGFIGTSLSSPEFAGLLALKVEESGRLGNVNPLLYELAAKNATAKPFQYFHENIPGYNGVVHVSAASKPYNPIVGVGTPNARMFLGVPELPLAGDPQTISNP